MMNGDAGQLLDGTDAGTRIVLYACMDQIMATKLPGIGQVNVANQPEAGSGAGPYHLSEAQHPPETMVDIYGNRHSLKLMGIGESPFD
jgi:hypothetical protein